MIPLDLGGKVALVTGVGDNESFAWFISKSLQAAGARVVLACHPRMVSIVNTILTRDADRESRLLPDGKSEFKPEKVLPMDAGYDTRMETAIAKIVATDNDFECAHIGMQVMGGAGFSMEHDMQRLFRDSRLGPIGGGSNEIQRNIIAKLMGL